MRSRTLPLLPSALALAFALVVALPIAAAAQSGLPATVSMYPAVAGPGDTVEVTGLDFPSDMTVVIELTTPAGKSTLATVATGSNGSFRELVALPAAAAEGAWSLSARSADGRAHPRYDFTSGEVSTAAPADAADVTVAPAPVAGETTADKMVLVLIALVLGVLATAVMYAYRLGQEDRRQPGMGTGDDLIWSGSSNAAPPESGPETTAAGEPRSKQASVSEPQPDEPESASTVATAQEVPTSA